MSKLTVRDKTFVPFLPEALILEKVKELAAQLNKDYSGVLPL